MDNVSCIIPGLFKSAETVFSRQPDIIINREKQIEIYETGQNMSFDLRKKI